MFKGEVKITVFKKERGLKFGTLSFGLFCEAEGIKLSEVEDRIKNPGHFTEINLMYAAAVAYCKIYGIEIDFTKEQVSAWIDEVGSSVIANKMLDALKSPSKKNTSQKKAEKSGK